MSLPSILIRKSTGEVIKHANYPRADMALIDGLDPDLEWLIKRELFIAPDYDSRIFILNQNEAITTTSDIEYPHLNQYQITYSTEKRSNDDIQISVENAERQANESVFPYTEQLKTMLLGIAVLFRANDGLALNPKEQVVADKVLALAVKVWKNDQAMQDKIQEIVDGTEPNIDEGWEKDELATI